MTNEQTDNGIKIGLVLIGAYVAYRVVWPLIKGAETITKGASAVLGAAAEGYALSAEIARKLFASVTKDGGVQLNAKVRLPSGKIVTPSSVSFRGDVPLATYDNQVVQVTKRGADGIYASVTLRDMTFGPDGRIKALDLNSGKYLDAPAGQKLAYASNVYEQNSSGRATKV